MARTAHTSLRIFVLCLGIGLLLPPIEDRPSPQVGAGAPVHASELDDLILPPVAIPRVAHPAVDVAPERRIAPLSIVLALGADLAPPLRARVERLLRESASCPIYLLGESEALGVLRPDVLLLAIGDHPLTRELIPPAELARLSPEGFIVRSGRRGTSPLLAADGRPGAEQARGQGNRGAAYAAYALLGELGFGFLHPLSPTRPDSLFIPPGPIALREQPRWRFRGMHYHTQHPIEITDMLQGWGPGGPGDEAGFLASLAEWDLVLEWLIANRQNAVEWILLWAEKWKDFADSEVRLRRLRALVERAHAFGIAVGLDVPLVFAQQHAFRLLRRQGQLADELAEIRARIDWLMGAGFDFLGTESGTSEFTHPDPQRMLAWMNEFTRYLADRHGKPAFIKIHCSSGQKIQGLSDPVTGKDLDFNFLPALADARLGVLVHTVQHYGLTDPAPTYGNEDFGHLHRFLASQRGKRPVLFYPESAYWVSFDVDVPLFLPVYAYNRLQDLRLLAAEEDSAGPGAPRMDGQMLFSSGWEWGYWLNDVIAARAAWDPLEGTLSPGEAFRHALAGALAPLGDVSAPLVELLGDTAEAQRDLLIQWRVLGEPPGNIRRRNGQAYLQGFETWDDLSELAERLGLPGAQMTQPDRLGLIELSGGGKARMVYEDEIRPLLGELEDVFTGLSARALGLSSRAGVVAWPIVAEITDALGMTALRAAQIRALYDHVHRGSPGALHRARKILARALEISAQRQQHYRVDPRRVTSWATNPTAYPFGYLWTARTLFYWRRDEGKAVERPLSPCYQNLLNPVALSVGDGWVADLARTLSGWLSFGNFRGCLAEPVQEPRWPERN